ncbi:hypothetical protein EYR36_010745 [Pleurotus pulmonarius]|nr:hypothetical protein EYR36_010745 [Pleurotus pulmonarius]
MSVLGSTAWSVNATIVVTALLTLIAHSFFAWRVYILSRKWFIPCLIAFLGTGHVATSWAVAGIAFGIDKYADISHSWENLTTGSLALGGATDLMIALSLGYHLHHARSGITKTDKLINKLIFWAVNIGILTSIADFTVVALISAQHAKSLAFVAVYEVVSNLYAASMLATLNIRQFTRDHVLDEHGTVIHLDSLPSHVKIKKSVTIVSDANFKRDAQGESRCTIPSASLSNENIGIPSETKESLHNSLSDKERKDNLASIPRFPVRQVAFTLPGMLRSDPVFYEPTSFRRRYGHPTGLVVLVPFSEGSCISLFCVLAQLLLVNAAVLEQRADQFVCDANGSRGGCDTTAAGKCIRALKAQFTPVAGGKLSWSGNYGAYSGGCRCYAQCRTGPNYPTCIVGSTRYDDIFYGLRNACISSAAHALGYIYADNAKWEFARYP